MEVTPLLSDGRPMIKIKSSGEMLAFLDEVSVSMPEDLNELSCERCSEKNAKIFQVTGNYCLHCWQEETHPDV